MRLGHDPVAIKRRGGAGDDHSTGQHGREAQMCGSSNDAAGTLPAHERLGDDTADWRDTILGADRGVH